MTEGGRHIAILGAGIIGCTIAYYITLLNEDPNLEITVIEKTDIACAASGRAAGFITSNWNDGGPLQDLTQHSFRLHAELAKNLNGKVTYDYRPIQTLSITASIRAQSTKEPPIDWLKSKLIQKTECIGTTETTAQLHPYKFCQTLIKEAKSRGAKVRIASVEGLIFDKYKITAVRLNDEVILPVDTIIVAMGPWSGPCLQWLVKQGGRMYSLPDVNGQRAHSLLLRPSVPISPHICFMALSLGHKFSEPEFYPRPDGDVFVSGEIDNGVLPESANEFKPNPTSIKNLKRDCNLLSPDVLGKATVVKENCCWMPISSDTLPLIGKVPWLDGVYVATGHNVWGISNCTGTGLVIAEMVLTGQAPSIDVRALAPLRPKIPRVHQ